MNVLVISLASIALLLKGIVLTKAFSRREESALFFSLTSMYCAGNLFSLLIVLNVADPSVVEWVIRPLYVSTAWGLALMCAYSIQAAGLGKKLNNIVIFIYILLAILTLAILGTDSIIVGLTSIGYSSTAIKGEQFTFYLIFVAACFIFTIFTLLAGAIKAKSIKTKNRCSWTLIALLPIIIVGMVVAFALNFGIKLNGSGLFPMATTLFLLITLKTESLHGLTDIRRFLPFSKEKKATSELQHLFSEYAMGEISYKTMKDGIEQIAVRYKFNKNSNFSETARAMGLHRSTLHSIVKRHHIDNTI